MGRRLHLGIDHPSAVVTVGTGSRRTLENALDVAALAGSVGMHPGQRKLGLVVIETNTGTGTFGRHQRTGKRDKQCDCDSNQCSPTVLVH